jgi:hypothetical protein
LEGALDFFGTIAGQIDAVRLPLFAVTLTAVPRANTPVLLMLHWHGFRRALPVPAAERETLSPVPGSALQINAPWRELASIDEAMLDAAWRLGAWQLDREEKRACATAGASERESFECRQAFGENPLDDGRQDHLVAEAPDRPDMLSLAAEVGYVRWQFRPVQGGLWQETASDDTLSAAGGREPPCPVGVQAPVGTRVSRTRYRLGRLRRLILP